MVRLIPFVYNTTITYKVELGNLYARFFYNNIVVITIPTPYLEEHLFELHIKQVGDVMWIIHKKYEPRKLYRTDTQTFSIDVIPFNKGPFLLRNDLIDPTKVNSASMTYTGSVARESKGTLFCCSPSTATYTITQMITSDDITIVGQGDLTSVFPVGFTFSVVGNAYSPNNTSWTVSSTSYSAPTFTIHVTAHIYGSANGGTITVTATGNAVNFFDPLHVGALFKIINKRSQIVSNPNSLAAVGTICNAMDVKGTYTFKTTAFTTSITGTIILERSENGTDWDTTFSTNSNEIYTKVEDSDNVQYRARVTAVSGGTLEASISVTDTTVSGIVRVIEYVNPSLVRVEVLTKLDSANGNVATKKWAEGAWSNYRTWPTSITFLADRCIYGGQQTINKQVTY